ncbi:hypothetical protein L204_100847 [Cryptococcus depauperatus]
MYWYISFLRPPPVSVTLYSESLLVTPQVANDLRTELRYEPTKIYYTWQRIAPKNSEPEALKELTTFMPPASTYKPLAIPLSLQAQVGDSWRLGLFSCGSRSQNCKDAEPEPVNHLLDLVQQPKILGVWSEGIEIIRLPGGMNNGAVRGMGKQKERPEDVGRCARAKKGKEKEKERYDVPKQGRIHRELILPLVRQNQQPSLKIIEQTSFDLDKKVWDSGLALSAWLHEHLSDSMTLPPLGQRILSLLTQKERLKVIELGSGTGLVSIALSLAHPNQSTSRWDITATDLESAMPLMNENLVLNSLGIVHLDHVVDETISSRLSVDAKVLDWDRPLPIWVAEDLPQLIIAADVTYNTSAFPSLLSTLSSLICPPNDSSAHPLLLMAYKERDSGERELWQMLEGQGIDMVKIDEVKGCEDYGFTEIWVGGTDLS